MLLARVALEQIGQELESIGLKSVLATMYPLAPNSPFAFCKNGSEALSVEGAGETLEEESIVLLQHR